MPGSETVRGPEPMTAEWRGAGRALLAARRLRAAWVLRAACAAAVVALGMTGCASEQEAPADKAAAPAQPSPVRFTDVTSQAGVAFKHQSGAAGRKFLPETMGSGVAVLDYDGDARPDLYFVNATRWPDDAKRGGAAPDRPALYRNNGDGTFSDTTLPAGLGAPFYGMGAAAADYDNDGDTDLFVSALGPDRLFRNDGGAFVEVGAASGVADPGFGSSAAFVDYNHDGDLDLFVCNYVEWTAATDIYCTLDGQNKAYCTPESYRGQSSRLYRNEGNGRFADVSKEAGVLNPAGKSLGVAIMDYDNDQWEDIVVANDTQPNFLYRNNHDGTFSDVGREVGVAFSEAGVARGAMGIDAGDYDHSGHESLVIGNFSNEMIGLYHNEGFGLFIDDAAPSGVGGPSLLTLAFGTFFFDHDLDGHLDIFVANGHVEDDINRVQKEVTYAQKPLLFRGVGDGTFEEVLPAGEADPLARPVVARGAAYLDHDADGDLDVVITTNNGPAYLWRNDASPDRAWIRVRLEGRRTNRDGIGAKVEIAAAGRTMRETVRSGSSYCSQSELVMTFGLGREEAVERISVTWPTGRTQVIDKPQVRSVIVVREEEEGQAADAAGRSGKATEAS